MKSGELEIETNNFKKTKNDLKEVDTTSVRFKHVCIYEKLLLNTFFQTKGTDDLSCLNSSVPSVVELRRA